MSTVAFVTGQESGLSDQQYVQRLRELLRDTPKPADEQASGLGNAVRYRLQTVPINDDNAFEVVVDGSVIAPVQTYNPATGPGAGTVYVDFDTGLLIFGTPPSANSNNITVTKNTVKWRNSVLLETLQDGMRAMYPRLGRIETDTTLTLVTNQWDYTLPPIFLDPNVRITDVAVQSIPSATEMFNPLTSWEQVGLGILRIPPSQEWPPGSTVQIIFEAPYASLSQIEPKAQALPLWYAGGMLMTFEEQKRVRIDTLNVASEGSANPVSAASNSGAALMRQFYLALDRMGRIPKTRRPTTTYQDYRP